MNNDDLYNRIDEDDEMTDAEKREAYFSEAEDEGEGEWKESQQIPPQE